MPVEDTPSEATARPEMAEPVAAKPLPSTVAVVEPSRRILFVDDERLVLEGIRRGLRASGATWDIVYETDPRVALARLQHEVFHVVVADMHMPGITGAALLAAVGAQQPDCVRVMLTGQADMNTALAAVNEGHVFRLLLKPCEKADLVRSLEQALRQYDLQTAERDLLRSRLEHAQRLAVVGEFTAGVTHDVNNLLSVVLTLARDSALFEPAKSLAMIEDAASRAAEMTKELMGFSRRDGADELEPVELGRAVRGCATLLRPMLAHEHKLELILPEEEVWVNSHLGRLRQIVSNLVINARDASPPQGRIVVIVESAELAEARPDVHREVRLTVRDEGHGMDEVTRARLFEPFFTTKAEGCGTGLGLALVQQLVRRLEGRIEVESALGAGAAFHIFLPSVETDLNP
ncbi:sensor histidine kinase [Actomonas aquatica]|uniref:histidine kinase n=1 Tax=Actomonas aquatica TaxID=2866162 RepID=A0ABZ1CEW9_9BACT|nr:ATP-binding protein [Opitutus sp. WL0086]WRQ89915.1 ATP-binding protein [Opitutus sp. WL0086]